MSHTPEHKEESPEVATVTPEAPTPVQQPQNVQYIVTEQSLEGIGGWLMFWMVMFSIAGIAYIVMFFAMIDQGVSEPSSVATLIASPILAIGYILSTVLIAMRQKLGQTVSIATLAVAGLFTSLNVILVANESLYGSSLALIASGILVSLVTSGLLILYFVLSKRVQKTLNK